MTLSNNSDCGCYSYGDDDFETTLESNISTNCSDKSIRSHAPLRETIFTSCPKIMGATNTLTTTKENPPRCSAVNHLPDLFPDQPSTSFLFSRNDSLTYRKSRHPKVHTLLFLLSLPLAILGSDSSKKNQ
mmetsp:Transcript_9752/g.17746  ORF Transcript_9752/g.17746 Transcript_9752/m.17746 type:complete len:130 (+) Transcript_9752:501-890(+)